MITKNFKKLPLLAGADVNVIAVDWYAGAGSINYFAAVRNTEPSGVSVAKFITWLNLETGASLSNYFLIGHSLGGHQVGIVGRNLGGQVPYILSIDPASPGWNFKPERFQKTDGIYTEVIHSNAGLMGYLVPLGDVDIYPNGGIDMPGCITPMCSHDKAVYYIAESMASGGFTAQECSSFFAAIRNKCNLPGSLKMGGLEPKTGISGVYRVDTNAFSPYSMG
ncbi:lipase member H-like [Trichoplusia ni]|uniref:Lipase member H-like n=1 Tax=Trichoplusia ni TaxID=7111 RepID=A0A7E5X4X2_TRINI|nr:lipase member H-like [Trichoplusia ni]